jgi:hypothetical protein
MRLVKNVWVGTLGMLIWAPGQLLQAQDARQIVQLAVNAEQTANRTDQSHWRYRDHQGHGNETVVVETERGAISRRVQVEGRPASPAEKKADDEHIQKFIHDPSMQQKQKRDGMHDERDATELLNLLPQAFFWKIESQTPEAITLSFRPEPNFHPPDMESRVMGGMTGTMVVSKEGHRIRTFQGRLENDVTIGFGLLARLKAGSTFDVERRLVGQGYWEITETHVHIGGHALFFKTIGQQDDEVKTDFTLVPAGTTLEQGVALLNAPLK